MTTEELPTLKAGTSVPDLALANDRVVLGDHALLRIRA